MRRVLFEKAGKATLLMAAALGTICPAMAADPAVSQTNLKVTATAGTADGDSAWTGVAGLTVPLSPSWGAQAEAGAMSTDGDTAYGLAGHVFTRDPDSYLAGVFLAHSGEDELDIRATRLGAETELYMEQVTLILKGGYQFSDLLEDTAFAEAALHWYPSDSFRLGAGISLQEDVTQGHADAEWLVGGQALPGLALRASAYVGDDDYDSIMGGITWYFGSDASLKDRHRRQDPDSALFSLFHAVQDARAGLCNSAPQQQLNLLVACTIQPPPLN